MYLQLGFAAACSQKAGQRQQFSFLQTEPGTFVNLAKSKFNDIPALVEAALETVEQVSALTLEEILAADHAAREAVRAHI